MILKDRKKTHARNLYALGLSGLNAYTPLMAAAEWGHTRVMEILLKKGADVNAVADRGRTALNTAAIDHWDTIPLLLSYGADIHAVNDSALLTAFQVRNYRAANLLLAHGANVNAYDKNGCTALIWAVIWRWPDLVKSLLESGADKAPKDKQRKTALDYAAQLAEVHPDERIEAIRQMLI